MSQATKRALLALFVIALGICGRASLDASMSRPRPRLRHPLSSLPLQIGTWIGRDEPIDQDVLERTQADEYINRVYEDPHRPGRAFKLWINYSNTGLNLRHSPEICLPSGGWTKVEAMTSVLPIERPDGATQPIMRLGYAQDDLIEGIAFWYYIFGEGPMERFARSLPIGSRSGHGRATRGSGLTVEVFHQGGASHDAETVADFASTLLDALEPLLPLDRAAYYIP